MGGGHGDVDMGRGAVGIDAEDNVPGAHLGVVVQPAGGVGAGAEHVVAEHGRKGPAGLFMGELISGDTGGSYGRLRVRAVYVVAGLHPAGVRPGHAVGPKLLGLRQQGQDVFLGDGLAVPEGSRGVLGVRDGPGGPGFHGLADHGPLLRLRDGAARRERAGQAEDQGQKQNRFHAAYFFSSPVASWVR